MFELREAFGWLSAGVLHGHGATTVRGVSTDTRTIRDGDLFVAIRGERHDAHDFLADAQSAGAASLLVERIVPGIRVPTLEVDDTRRALGEIAAGWRRRLALPVIAVTGSNGKTTVKEMVSAILAACHGEANRFATRGNLNNDIGVPLSVFALQPGHRAAVLELGMNRPGEIAWLAHIAAPQVALVNNAQREHQEFMQSVEATARENGSVFTLLGADGTAVFPGDDENTQVWRELAGRRRTIEFGLDPRLLVHAPADADPSAFTLTLAGASIPVTLSIDGRHNVRNALAAAACTHALGVPAPMIAAGLAAFRPARGRLVRRQTLAGAALIDDSYNANPDSVRAAIDVLADAAAPRVLVLGDMGEVGERGPEFHREVGAYAAARGIDTLLGFGEAMRDGVAAFGPGAEHFDSLAQLVARLLEAAKPPATTLVKGSRFMRMERVVSALCDRDVAGGEAH